MANYKHDLRSTHERSGRPSRQARETLESSELEKPMVAAQSDNEVTTTRLRSMENIPDDESASIDSRREVMKVQCWNLTVCAILHFIDNQRGDQSVHPVDIAKGVVRDYCTYYWSRKSLRFQERGLDDFRKISEVMALLVGSRRFCIATSQRTLASQGSKVCTADFLRQIEYGTRLPPTRHTRPTSQDSTTNLALHNDEAAGVRRYGTRVEIPVMPAVKTCDKGQPKLRLSPDQAIAAGVPRQRRQSLRFSSPDSTRLASADMQNDNRKRKISGPAYPEAKRTHLATTPEADCEAPSAPNGQSPLRTEGQHVAVHSPQPSCVFLDSTDFYLDNDSLKSQMQHLYSASISFVEIQMFEKQGYSFKQSAAFVLDQECDVQLRGLYETLLGKGAVGLLRYDIYSAMRGPDLVVALIGAFLYSTVFTRSGSETAENWLKDVVASAGRRLPLMEKQLNALGTDLDTISRRAYLSDIYLPYFQDSILGPIAHSLADELSVRLFDHLSAHKHDEIGAIRSRNEAILSWSQPLVRLMKRALTLKCELSSAREGYRLQWFSSGTKFDVARMENTRAPGEDVLVCIFPGLVVTSDNLVKTIYAAQVRLR